MSSEVVSLADLRALENRLDFDIEALIQSLDVTTDILV